jgi:DNA polymerase
MTDCFSGKMSEESGLFQIPSGDRGGARMAVWDECGNRAARCAACGLSSTRRSVVFGEGDRDTRLMFIGEGPGADEDDQGRPFVGKAGQLLTQILAAAGINRSEVYITNVVKCRPPENRVPLPEEMAACDPLLQTQILLLRPSIIVLLGSTPTKWILKTTEGISKLRGRWYDWRGTAIMPMFHPSYLLRNPNDKKHGSPKHLTWQDIREIKRQWESVKSSGRMEGIDLGRPS